MSLGNVAVGLASLVLGVHHLRKGASQIAAARSGSLEGMAARRGAMPAPRRGVDVPGRAFHNSGRRPVATRNGNRTMRLRSFHIRTLDDRIAYLRRLADEGKRDPAVYAFARRALSKKCGNTWCVPEKDNMGEARVLFGELRRAVPPKQTARDIGTARGVFKNLRRNVRYTSDIEGVDTYQKPSHTLALGTADCLPGGTLLLRMDGLLIPIEEIRVGDRIFDGFSWTTVTNWWHKGVQDLRAFQLNNGSTALRCTEGHRLFRVPGGKTASAAQEVFAHDIQLGDNLLQPHELGMPEEVALSTDEALLLGAYVAEGSIRRRRSDGTIATVSIAGIADSKGVREQVIEAGARLGLRVSAHKREVYLTDPGGFLDGLVGSCGAHAAEKRLPHVRWTNSTAIAILTGLDADGGVATNGTNFVFSTTSWVLALQYRLLQLRFGKSCSVKKVSDHGGFGENPIFRVTVRKDRVRRPWAKVRGIFDGGSDHVFDIETDSKRFYLPEQDVVVHNCDDYSSTTCAALGSVGIPCRYKVIRTKGARDWNHIYAQAGFPRANPQRWISMDSSVNMPFGWEAPKRMVAASRVFRVR